MARLKSKLLLLIFIFSNEIRATEQREIEIPCKSLSEAIRESFKKIPHGTLQEIRPLYRKDGKVEVAFSSRPSPEATISVYRCGLEASLAYGKIVGFEYKGSRDDDYIQFRLDWDREKGGHINLHIGKEESKKKFAFTIKERGKKDGTPITSEKDFESHISRLDKPGRSARDIVSILMGLSNIKGCHINNLRGAKRKYLEEEIARQLNNQPPQPEGEPDPYEQSGQWAENNSETQAG